MLQKIFRSWKQYRYRFVPWLALNLKDRSTRYVEKSSRDKTLDDKVIEQTLLNLFESFQDAFRPAAQNTEDYLHDTNLNIMYQTLGFKVIKIKSDIPDGGDGVGVIEGKIPKGSVAALYPGTIYQPTHPMFYQSIGNPYIFRCIDGLLIDGSDSGISRFLYKSCANRENACGTRMCDNTWMTNTPVSPLAIGQFVNNHTPEFPPNVAYQEFDLPDSFPLYLRKYIPNVPNRRIGDDGLDQSQITDRSTRMVVLVSLRDIHEGEELFSSYFTLVQNEDNKNS